MDLRISVLRGAALGGVGLLWGGLTLVWTVRLWANAPDDMFITYRYAWNLAHGEGFVFNPGERVFGLTNPGFALLLALLHVLSRLPIHLLGGSLFATAFVVLVLILWKEGRANECGASMAVGGTFALASSYLWITTGSAVTCVLGLLAGAAILVERRPVPAGLLGGLAVWFRPDAALGLGALALMAWLKSRHLPRRFILAAAGMLLLGLLAAFLWFGTVLPQTLEAKRIMASAREIAWAGPERFWARAAPLLARHFGQSWLMLVALGIAGLWPLFERGGVATRTLILYGGATAVAYPLLGVPFFNWYTVPAIFTLLLGVGAFAVETGRSLVRALPIQSSRLEDRWPRGHVLAALVAVVILAVPAVSFSTATLQRFEGMAGRSRFDTYRDVACWIRENSVPGERIAYGEIGNLAYWSRRPVDDLLGLVTPEALPFVAARDPVGAFLRRPPDYFIDHPASPHPGIARFEWFEKSYRPVARFEGAVVYRRTRDSRLPGPRQPRTPEASPGA